MMALELSVVMSQPMALIAQGASTPKAALKRPDPLITVVVVTASPSGRRRRPETGTNTGGVGGGP